MVVGWCQNPIWHSSTITQAISFFLLLSLFFHSTNAFACITTFDIIPQRTASAQNHIFAHHSIAPHLIFAQHIIASLHLIVIFITSSVETHRTGIAASFSLAKSWSRIACVVIGLSLSFRWGEMSSVTSTADLDLRNASGRLMSRKQLIPFLLLRTN